MLERIKPGVAPYGIELSALLVENISLPPEVEQALDSRTKMGVIGNLDAYTKFQAAEAMKEAAKNPSGTAGAGMGMGMGFAMANQMAQGMSGGAAAAPPPVPGNAGVFFIAVNGQQTGPFDLSSISGKARSGELTRETLVWKQGMAQWSPAGSVSELANLFGPTPPPVPR